MPRQFSPLVSRDSKFTTALEVGEQLIAAGAMRQPFNSCIREMTTGEVSVMIPLMSTFDASKREELAQDMRDRKVGGLPFIMISRLEAVHPEAKDRIDPEVLFFFSVASGGRPGTAVLYVAMLFYWLVNQPSGARLSMTELATHIIPYGVPTDDFLQMVWDAQKREREGGFGSDNWLDMGEAWMIPTGGENVSVHAAASAE